MRVLLQRNLFAEGSRYRVNAAGTEIPDHVELPAGAKVWDGKEFVKPPDDKKGREALAKKSSKAVEEEEEKAKEEAPDPNIFRVYSPQYRSPKSPEAIQGAMPVSGDERKAEEEREKKERRAELARIKAEEAGEEPPKAEEPKTPAPKAK